MYFRNLEKPLLLWAACWNFDISFFMEQKTYNEPSWDSSNWVNYTYMTECVARTLAVLSFIIKFYEISLQSSYGNVLSFSNVLLQFSRFGKIAANYSRILSMGECRECNDMRCSSAKLLPEEFSNLFDLLWGPIKSFTKALTSNVISTNETWWICDEYSSICEGQGNTKYILEKFQNILMRYGCWH